MGAWGVGNFENDDACDWMYGLNNSGDKTVISKALHSVLENTGYIEAPACSEAIAAAEVVLAGVSNDHSNVPNEVSAWLSRKSGLFRKPIKFNSSDIDMAIEVLNKILDSSELRELWEESDYYEEWKSTEIELVEKMSKYSRL